jgi:hypothetical protein
MKVKVVHIQTVNQNVFNHFKAAVVLVGGPDSSSGNVFARNPTTGVYGPVCDDNFELVDVTMI